jgi:alkanesulfonate monooxygenase SsuD/methylene tetrahydromethanopterin reductase-like flavin-dependent oxidoreductase (luciferase family)
MKIGLLMPFTEETANPADFCRTAEELGYESMWVPEHPVLPANPKTPFPQGGPIPPVYSHMGDQFIALSMAAAATKKTQARDRHLPGPRAQPAHPGQADR